MKNTGKEYEKLSKLVYEQILQIQGFKDCNVQHDVEIQGKDTKHQIDVYWEIDVAGIITKYLIQAKDHNKPITKGMMLEFVSVVDDIKNSHGIFISKSGFQKGAKELAEKNGIKIYELRDSKKEDFSGKMMNMEIELIISSLYYDNLQIDAISQEQGKFKISGDTIIYDSKSERKIGKIIAELCKNNGVNIKYTEYNFNNSYVIINNQKILLKKISGYFGIKEYKETIKINGYDRIGKILYDVLEKDITLFDKNNNYIKKI